MRKLKKREKQIEAFATGADPALGEPTKQKKHSSQNEPDAPHNHCSINLGLNKYEKDLLDKISKITGRSRLNVLRQALLEYSSKHG